MSDFPPHRIDTVTTETPIELSPWVKPINICQRRGAVLLTHGGSIFIAT